MNQTRKTAIIMVHTGLRAGFTFNCQPPECYCLSAEADAICRGTTDPVPALPTDSLPDGVPLFWPTVGSYWFEPPEAINYPKSVN